MNYSYEQMREMYLELPEDLKDAYFSVDISDKIAQIGGKHGLEVDKMGQLGGEVGYILLGITHPNKFIPNLADKLGLDKTKAREIAEEINKEIFFPIRDSLRKIHNIRESALGGETSKLDRKDILNEIEKDHTQDYVVPEILKGSITPFDAKVKEGIFKLETEEAIYEEKPADKTDKSQTAAPKQDKYQGIDPYREPVE